MYIYLFFFIYLFIYFFIYVKYNFSAINTCQNGVHFAHPILWYCILPSLNGIFMCTSVVLIIILYKKTNYVLEAGLCLKTFTIHSSC